MVRGLVWGLLGGLFGPRAADRSAEKESGKGDDEPEEWATVLSVYNAVHAQIATARLEDEGIPVRQRRDWADGALAINVGHFGRVDIRVPRPLLDQARTILADTMGVEFADEDPSPD
jgi:hypothetical protein